MLELKNIVKNYYVGDTTVEALKGVSIQFRQNEFVSILGPSGCGKTTLLNIIGGLDQYTSGDLIINGRSTKDFKDRDWDSYRNHSIGFIFQSYNLIPHQTVLANVELALTLAGISKKERTRRATEALEKVGLGDQLDKKPNQMSGGQMQRVAIARALVNDPDIILADEPTGALDSKTSVQIMDILKEVSKDKLIIMVTHNPDIAEQYSTRIINLSDGAVTHDSNPYHEEAVEDTLGDKLKKTSMSFKTALTLSLNNLMTKKGRTILTAFAGSIGIIGIALILSLSNGVQDYITQVEEDTLSSYPITIQQESLDISSLMTSFTSQTEESEHDRDQVYSMNIMNDMLDMMMSEINSNDLASFKTFIEEESDLDEYTTDIQYSYSTTMNIYKADTSDGLYQVNPTTIFEDMGLVTDSSTSSTLSSSSFVNTSVWTEMLGNTELLEKQYDVLAGRMPESYDEVVLIVDQNNEVTDYTLYSLGILDSQELSDYLTAYMNGEDPEIDTTIHSYSYEEILDLRYKLIVNTDYYQKVGDTYVDMSDDEVYMTEVVNNGTEIKVVGIIRPNEDSTVTTTGCIGYTSELMEYLIEQVNESEIVQEQIANPDVDVFTNLPFESDTTTLSMDELNAYIATLSETEQAEMQAKIAQAQAAGMSEEAILEAFSSSLSQTSTNTYDDNMTLLGVSDLDNPSSISIYPKDFESKDIITGIIDDYNQEMTDAGNEDLVIQYTDIVGVLLTSVTSIINTISYVLIAFVAISLVVSSIMIAIITYISVLERTKEIGILRSIGASKKDITRVFNAETFITGLSAGVLGIVCTLILSIPANIIIENVTGIDNICKLPADAAIILIVISIVITLLAGFVPSKMAAKKDPATALRTE